jgi:protease-4
MVPDFSKTLDDRLHVNVVSVNSNPHADMYSMMRPLNGDEKQYMQNSVERIYRKFTGLVAKGRNLSISHVENIAQGRVWTGADALKIGLVDEIGTIENAIDWAINSISLYVDVNDISIESYPKPLTNWEFLMSQLESSEPDILAGTPFKNVGEAFKSWTDAQAGKVYARVPYEFVIR